MLPSPRFRRSVPLLFLVFSGLGLLAPSAPDAAARNAQGGIGLKLVAEGFTSPVNLLPIPDGSGRLLIGDQVGTVRVLEKNGQLAGPLFLDVRSKLTPLIEGFDERGLLGLAFHPKYPKQPKLYVYYSGPRRSALSTNWDHTSVLSEFRVDKVSGSVDLASERVLLQIDKPQRNHNCGRLLFGPDGYLYIGVGDGGGANDNEFGHAAPRGNGQDISTLLGKILRIDVNHGDPYAIPPSNPFADGKEGRPEIFAFGLRNPWGLSFDRRGAREFFAADVGQNLYEELNIIVKGGNYGWRIREGFHPFDATNANVSPQSAPTVDAAGRPLIDPILEYKHPPRNKLDPAQLEGISVTGGYVYRGKALPQLRGKYVFADWSRNWAIPDGVLFVAERVSKDPKIPWKLGFLPLNNPANGKVGAYIVALGEDARGELYVLTNGRNSITGNTGKVFQLVPM